MKPTRNPPSSTTAASPAPPRRPGAETLSRSPEANATQSRAKGVPQPAEDNRARYEAIQRAAYQRAEKRGFEPGHEMDDWLEAEKEYESTRSSGSEKH